MKMFRKALRSFQRRAVKLVLPNPRRVYGEYSMIYDTLNTSGAPGEYLIDLALRAAPTSHFEEMSLEEAERYLIQRALGKCDGNVSEAAKLLGVSRSALYRRLEAYGLKES